MYVFPPILHQMVRDRRVTPTDMRVFVVASQLLDFEEFRPLKILQIAHEMHTDVSWVARSMRHLVRLGYIQRRQETGPDGALVYTMRLPFSQRVAKSTTTKPPDAA